MATNYDLPQREIHLTVPGDVPENEWRVAEEEDRWSPTTAAPYRAYIAALLETANHEYQAWWDAQIGLAAGWIRRMGYDDPATVARDAYNLAEAWIARLFGRGRLEDLRILRIWPAVTEKKGAVVALAIGWTERGLEWAQNRSRVVELNCEGSKPWPGIEPNRRLLVLGRAHRSAVQAAKKATERFYARYNRAEEGVRTPEQWAERVLRFARPGSRWYQSGYHENRLHRLGCDNPECWCCEGDEEGIWLSHEEAQTRAEIRVKESLAHQIQTVLYRLDRGCPYSPWKPLCEGLHTPALPPAEEESIEEDRAAA